MKFLKYTKLFTVILLAFLFLVACGTNSKPGSSHFQNFDSKGFDQRIGYYYEGDKVTKQTTDNIIYYSYLEYLGVTDAASAEEFFAPEVELYQDIEGVSHQIDYLEDRLVEKIEIDYTKADLVEIAPLVGISEEDAKKLDYISFKESKTLLEGFTEVTDGNFQELP